MWLGTLAFVSRNTALCQDWTIEILRVIKHAHVADLNITQTSVIDTQLSEYVSVLLSRPFFLNESLNLFKQRIFMLLAMAFIPLVGLKCHATIEGLVVFACDVSHQSSHLIGKNVASVLQFTDLLFIMIHDSHYHLSQLLSGHELRLLLLPDILPIAMCILNCQTKVYLPVAMDASMALSLSLIHI